MDSLKTSILKCLYFSGPLSIAELSERIGKSVPIVTRNVNELLSEEDVIESGRRASTGGRRAMDYILNTQKHGCIVAVAIDQYATQVVALDMENSRLTAVKIVSADLSFDHQACDKILQAIEQTVAEVNDRGILAIGVTVPGFVDASLGVNNSYRSSSPLYNLKDNIKAIFKIPTFIENDSTAIAIAEQYFGKARGMSDALVVNLNWGVGLGMIIQKQLFRGHSGFAGEFSHIPLADESRLCSCGKKGCLEVEASLLCVFDEVKEAIARGENSYLDGAFHNSHDIVFPLILAAYERGDQLVIRALKRIAQMLGKGFATLIHIMNPETLIVSGRGAAFGEILRTQIQSSLQEYCIPRLSKQTTLEISDIQDVQLLSSACIAIQQIPSIQKHKHKHKQTNE